MKDIYLYGVVGDWWGDDSINASRVKNELDGCEEDVCFHVNSPGGDAFEGVAINGVIKTWRDNSGQKAICSVEGLAASAASYMALSADEITILPGSMMMIHQPSTMCDGNAAGLRKQADLLDKLAISIAKIYAEKTGADMDQLLEDMEGELWLDSDEAVEYGLADRVDIDAAPVAACADRRVLGSYKRVPEKLALADTLDKTPIEDHEEEGAGAAPASEGEAPKRFTSVLGHVYSM